MDKRILKLIFQRRKIQEQIWDRLNEVYPRGTVIYFDHHGYMQQGIVISVLGFRGCDHPTLFVENLRTGKKREVGLYSL